MTMMQLILGLSLLLGLGTSAFADQPQQLADPKATLERTGKPLAASAIPGRMEGFFITNNCEVCTRQVASAACSSVGIACPPTQWRCLRTRGPNSGARLAAG